MFWPQRLSFPRSNGLDNLGDVRREVVRLRQEVDALRADMRAVQEERGVVVRSVSQSSDSLDVLSGSTTPSAICNGSSSPAASSPISRETFSISPGASSVIPLESLQHCERQYGASYGASGGASWTSVRGVSLLSRVSSAMGRVWNEDQWHYRDESQISLSAKILLRLSGASCGECYGWRRLVVHWTSAIWLTGYLLFSIVWIVSIMKLQSGPAELCKAAADTLVLFAGLTHWISIMCLRPVSSVQGVNVTLAVFLVASGMGIRLLTTLAGFTSPHLHYYGRASILPFVLIVIFLLSLAQGAAAVIFQDECFALCKAVNNRCNKSISPGDHSHLHKHAQATKRRWRPFLLLHLMPEFGAIALYTFSGLIETRSHNWVGLVEQSGHVISTLMYVLSQVVPLVTYNEAVLQAKLALEEFASLQRLNRAPLEFSVCGIVMGKSTFRFFLIAGITSALSGSIKYYVCLVLGVEH